MLNKIIKESYHRRSVIRDYEGEKQFRELVDIGYPGYGNIVEVGTCMGLSTIILAQKVKGTVHTYDVKDYSEKTMFWEAFNITNKIKFHNSKVYVPDYEYTFAFIDGDHKYDGVLYDFKTLKTCGRILSHDYGKSFPGVKQVVNSIGYGDLIVKGVFALWLNK